MTHATVFTAVHLDKDEMPVRWRVENSCSEAAGVGGYFVMSLPGCHRQVGSRKGCQGCHEAGTHGLAALGPDGCSGLGLRTIVRTYCCSF